MPQPTSARMGVPWWSCCGGPTFGELSKGNWMVAGMRRCADEVSGWPDEPRVALLECVAVSTRFPAGHRSTRVRPFRVLTFCPPRSAGGEPRPAGALGVVVVGGR